MFFLILDKVWLLGNLARASYVGSSNWVWPYSYDKCNQEVRFNQELNACRKDGNYGLTPNVGRGAPEIDILEAMMGEAGPLPNTPIERPYFSSSLQVNTYLIFEIIFFKLYYVQIIIMKPRCL